VELGNPRVELLGFLQNKHSALTQNHKIFFENRSDLSEKP